jgi:hypothetical protein
VPVAEQVKGQQQQPPGQQPKRRQPQQQAAAAAPSATLPRDLQSADAVLLGVSFISPR